jgi:hypothetical protein
VRSKRIKLICSIGMFVLCIGLAMSPVQAGQRIQTSQNGQAAGGNPAILEPSTISALEAAAVSRRRPITVAASVNRLECPLVVAPKRASSRCKIGR